MHESPFPLLHHAAPVCSQDWREQLITTKKDLDPTYVRYHGTLDEDMVHYDDNVFLVCRCSLRRRSHRAGEPVPVQFLQSVQQHGLHPQHWYTSRIVRLPFACISGMKPIVELSFTPDPLASTNNTCFYYKGDCSPPTNLTLYNFLVNAYVAGMTARYGVEEVSTWLFEVYNEPDLAEAFTQAECDCLNHTTFAHGACTATLHCTHRRRWPSRRSAAHTASAARPRVCVRVTGMGD